MIFLFLSGTCLVLMILNNLAIVLGALPRSDYDFWTQFMILVFVCGLAWVRRARNIRWFGKELEASHNVNAIMTRLVSTFGVLPPFFFSIYPWIHRFAEK